MINGLLGLVLNADYEYHISFKIESFFFEKK